jgi:rhodanese-related sulfurtransferase
MRLDPHYPPDYLRVLGQALFHQEHYGEAAELFERVVSRQPDLSEDHATLAAAYGHLGRAEDAASAIGKYNEILARTGYSPLTVQEIGYWWYGDLFDYDQAYRERLLDGLRKAGVPEGAGTELDHASYKKLISRSAGEYEVAGAVKIDAATAKALHDRGVVFVDVRDAGSFGRGHIPGAAHLDLNIGLSEESLSRLVGKDEEVAFSCWGKYCPYAAYASAKAIAWGFTRVHYFAGGVPAWMDAGYPVESSPSF